MSLRRIISLVALVLAAGCAGGAGWRNPSLPPGQEHADFTACRKEAEEDMGPQPYTAPGSERTDTPLQMVDRSEQRQTYNRLVADCMERKGYKQGE